MLTKTYLRRVRNDIPVDKVIADILRIEHRIQEARFRFLCPICAEFNTATNPRTNLAHCFRCDKSFNPIDLVMHVKRYAFLDAVAFLTPYLDQPAFQKEPIRERTPPYNPRL